MDSLSLKDAPAQPTSKRAFDENLSEKYNGPDFNYDRIDGEAQNILAQFLDWVFKGLQSVFGVELSPNTLKVIEVVLYMIMGLLAFYVLIKFLIGENFASLFTKKAETLNDFFLVESEIEKVDLDGLITKAVAKDDFRLAIRYHYLKTLQLLSQKGIIRWHFEKTNSDYQNEITHATLKSRFKEVSYLYDHIWYGEQPIDALKYQKVRQPFTVFFSTLKS